MLLAIVLCGATAHHHGAPSAAPTSGHASMLAADVVLLRYEDALAKVSSPQTLIFEYTVEQAGPHNIQQTHRVYRQAAGERDELLAVDGRVLPSPLVRIITKRTDRYDVAVVAPRATQYEFRFARMQYDGGQTGYVFQTYSRAKSPFAVVDITIDADTFLPAVLDFHSATATGKASGRLIYGRADDHWLIRAATVSADMSGQPARERLTWSSYQFPASLPPSTFSQWHPIPHEPLTPRQL